ncbi:hypothetical protein K7B10_00690 [Streptomyces flavotricini]|uniref:Transposase n=1 Tax=Streptomyces flavotricini TaxID=66888 RepID=A0ABS8DX02_9ACTN|nr:hypothetical protein [Streptomyces flavotricini]MCC0093341.1 hypothetical protein [Streptomyces flavotricini]
MNWAQTYVQALDDDWKRDASRAALTNLKATLFWLRTNLPKCEAIGDRATASPSCAITARGGTVE